MGYVHKVTTEPELHWVARAESHMCMHIWNYNHFFSFLTKYEQNTNKLKLKK